MAESASHERCRTRRPQAPDASAFECRRRRGSSQLTAIAYCAVFLLAPLVALAAAPESSLTTAPAAAAAPGAISLEDAPVRLPQASPKALRYYYTGNWTWAVRQVWSLALPVLWLVTGASAALRTLARRMARRRFLETGIYAALFILLSTLATLPFSWYGGFYRPHAYGLSHQPLARWMGHLAMRTGVAMLGGFLLLWIPYWLVKRSPRRWWLYLGLLSFPFFFCVLLIKPVWYDPLFHDFHPMRDKSLEAQILALAQRAHIPADHVYEVDMSRDTTTVNAYVTGLLSTQRIVLWDTLLKDLNPDQVLFVMAHEMGHYVLGHVMRTILLLSLLNLAGFFLVYQITRAIVPRYSTRFGFDHLPDVASLPLVMLLCQVLSLAATPVAMAYSRAQEHEADRFALELTHANHTGGTAFVRLMSENLSNPWPGWFYTTWRATHPSLSQRVRFCNDYRPWREGRSLRYAALFQPARPAVSRAASLRRHSLSSP